jgi:hypothetical protein
MDGKGNLYGTTAQGGSGNCTGGCGTAFQLAPPATQGGPWTETVLHTFGKVHTFGKNNDGTYPVAGLTFGLHGAIFGTTQNSSDQANVGTVFKLKPPAIQGGFMDRGGALPFHRW